MTLKFGVSFREQERYSDTNELNFKHKLINASNLLLFSFSKFLNF